MIGECCRVAAEERLGGPPGPFCGFNAESICGPVVDGG